MTEVNVTELRKRLPTYLKRVQSGEEIRVTSRGRIIARVVPELDDRERASALLATLRCGAKVGDVVSPIDVDWAALGDPA